MSVKAAVKKRKKYLQEKEYYAIAEECDQQGRKEVQLSGHLSGIPVGRVKLPEFEKHHSEENCW
jgi:hypothetical protein